MGSPLEVRLFAANALRFAPERLDQLASRLDAAERARAERFVFPVHRRRFVAAHGFLREVLARETGRAPDQLAFAFGPHGKPRLLGGGPHFSLTHTGEHVLLAVADEELGLDAEEIRPDRVEPPLAQRVMTDAEFAAWSRAPRDLQVDAFFRLWSAKESVMKACGLGLELGPQSFAVFAPGTLELGGPVAVDARRFQPALLVGPPGSALALASEREARIVRHAAD